MSQEQKGKQEKGGSNAAEKVVVAVKASKEIPKTALVWALTHVVQPGDCITLLVVVPSPGSGRKWSFPSFTGDCAGRKSHSGSNSEQKSDITDSFSQMILQLHDVYDPNKINVKIKIVPGSSSGEVALEAKRALARWVVLDKKLKHEEKRCIEELRCNIVVMKNSQAKVLRLNLVGSSEKETEASCQLNSGTGGASEKYSQNKDAPSGSILGSVVTPTSSPELGKPFTATEAGTSSVSSSDPGTSPFFNSEGNGDLKKVESLVIKEIEDLDECGSDPESENLSLAATSLRFQPWITEYLTSHRQSSGHLEETSGRVHDGAQASTTKALLDKFSELNREAGIGISSFRSDTEFSGNVREAVSLSRNAPLGPPPLCSICQHKAPEFGKPPRWFTYAELELATGGFSQSNFLAKGGFGSVHRGLLPDGQAIAVKQLKLASSQGDVEFCSEVEVLSCAQHRNVVMLIGFCIEDRRRLLVYEYICNGSLDSHLYGRHREPLEWSARQKIAVGAARGLRYLHEECRVGCIVHRDMRPNNILITHDFEPLVGDFGLARWQPDGDTGVETRVIGTFGPKDQQCLTEWARPLLEEYAIDELVDPRLKDRYSEHEFYCMLHAASLCVRRDPHSRPRMSQVLRILEGDVLMNANYSSPGYDADNLSGRLWTEQQRH
ncbi:inorganic pyrophosphatase 2 [Hibiscus syriacus]|uniref:Inorganic pyrophosphatase 2 n=1 Tax=Hibiscus syriacus TaxID=106335 RepID=A0A6A2YXM9_HIBSY|nr:inorganic pyrophosphatase 2 [Hibiscus syriacus]